MLMRILYKYIIINKVPKDQPIIYTVAPQKPLGHAHFPPFLYFVGWGIGMRMRILYTIYKARSVMNMLITY